MNHVEGGWPKEVDYTEAEHVIRYRKKVIQRAAWHIVEARIGLQLADLLCMFFDFYTGCNSNCSTCPRSNVVDKHMQSMQSVPVNCLHHGCCIAEVADVMVYFYVCRLRRMRNTSRA